MSQEDAPPAAEPAPAAAAESASAAAVAPAPVVESPAPSPQPSGSLSLSKPSIGALLLLGLVLTYAAVLVTPYAVTDDYFVLAQAMRGETFARDAEALKRAKRGEPSLVASFARGCVTSALLTGWAFEAAGDVPDLRYVRLIGVLGIALLAFLLFRALALAGWSTAQAACVALLVCTTPPFQVCASWSISFTVFYSCAACGVAWILADRGLAKGLARQRRALLLGGSLALLLFAVSIYQVTLMYFIVFCAIDLFRREGQQERFKARALGYTLIMAGGLVLGFLAYKFGLSLYGEWLASSRTKMVSNLGKKLDYFLSYPLRDALRMHKLEHVANLSFAIFLAIVGGLYFYFQGSRRWRLLMVAFALALVPGIYLPNLLSAENWGAFRTQLGLTSLLVVYAFLALHGWIALIRRRWRAAERAPAFVVAAAAGLAALMAAGNVTRYYAEPQLMELRIMQSQLARVDLSKLKKLHVAGSPWGHALNGSIYDEFGLPTTSQWWAEAPMAYVLVRQRLGYHPPYPIQMAPNNQIFRPPEGEYLVNMTRLDLFR